MCRPQIAKQTQKIWSVLLLPLVVLKWRLLQRRLHDTQYLLFPLLAPYMETLSCHWWHCTHIAETKERLLRGRMHKIVWQAPLLGSSSSLEVFVEASCYRRVIRRQLHNLWENFSLEIILKLNKSNHYSFKIFRRGEPGQSIPTNNNTSRSLLIFNGRTSVPLRSWLLLPLATNSP